MKMKSKNILLFFIIAFNSGIFLLYGTAKLIGFQFSYTPPPDLLLKDARHLTIMWYFFSVEKGYGTLVALSELIPAILIIFKKTRFLGILLYLVTIINILAINIFFVITPQTLGLSIVLFINAVIILITERQKLKLLLS